MDLTAPESSHPWVELFSRTDQEIEILGPPRILHSWHRILFIPLLHISLNIELSWGKAKNFTRYFFHFSCKITVFIGSQLFWNGLAGQLATVPISHGCHPYQTKRTWLLGQLCKIPLSGVGRLCSCIKQKGAHVVKLTWLLRLWSRLKVVQTAFAKIILFSPNILCKCWIKVLLFGIWANSEQTIPPLLRGWKC